MPDISTVKDLPDISFIEYKTVDDVKASMVADYEAYMTEATGKTYTLPRVSRDRFKLYAAAAQIYQAMKYVDIKGKMDTVKYSVGDFLDLLGAFRCGATRNQAAAAVTTIRFTLSAARASVTAIPQGTRIAAGQLFFETSVYTEIPAGDLTADIPATCMTAGETGNGLAPGELKTLVDPVPYVQSVENTSTSSGGADRESDESFAARIFIAPGKYSTAGSRNGYEYHVQDYSGRRLPPERRNDFRHEPAHERRNPPPDERPCDRSRPRRGKVYRFPHLLHQPKRQQPGCGDSAGGLRSG